MGIDVCIHYDGDGYLPDEESFDYDRWDAWYRNIQAMGGYLRESYFAKHYPTRVLLAEAFEIDKWRPDPALLKSRLPGVSELIVARYREDHGVTDPDELRGYVEHYVGFVQLYEQLADEGKNPYIYVSW